jgi:hypothetical protein
VKTAASRSEPGQQENEQVHGGFHTEADVEVEEDVEIPRNHSHASWRQASFGVLLMASLMVFGLSSQHHKSDVQAYNNTTRHKR